MFDSFELAAPREMPCSTKTPLNEGKPTEKEACCAERTRTVDSDVKFAQKTADVRTRSSPMCAIEGTHCA